MREVFKPLAEMNVVPYVDVMLVLVVILMITTPLLSQGVSVTLPRANAKVIDTKQKPPMIVSVDAKGAYYLNTSDQPAHSMATEPLLIRVAAEHQLDPQRMIVVKGDQGVNYGKVIKLMALLQKAGVEQVGMLTEKAENSQ